MSEDYLNRNHAKIWYRVAGQSEGPATVYLHGGPGYSSHSFEATIGPTLETRLKMIYMDQRGCGRSTELKDACPMSVNEIVSDLDELRLKLSLKTVNLVGHSFGGLVALEYLKAHREHVGKMILIDISPDLIAMVENQISWIGEIAERAFPEAHKNISTILLSGGSPLKKLAKIYRLVDPNALQLALFWFQEEGLRKNAAIDLIAGVDKNPSRLTPCLESSGYLERNHLELQFPLGVPAVLYSGRHSHCVGKKNLELAANVWQIPIEWFEFSGHMPYIEEPITFADRMFNFLLGSV